MRLSRIVFVVVIAISAAKLTQAQQQHDWIPQGIEALRQDASSKTEFTLDHSMLIFASKLDPRSLRQSHQIRRGPPERASPLAGEDLRRQTR